ncbi:MAG: magnesium transporter, partial [Chloroflexota bacterium]
ARPVNTTMFEELVRSERIRELRRHLTEMDADEIASLLESVREEYMAVAFRLLPKDTAVGVFDRLDSATQHRLLETLANRAAGRLLEAMSPDDRTELLEEVPASVARRLIGLLSPEQKKVTHQLLGYEEETVGREMSPYFVDLQADMTVAQAMQRIRRLSVDRETIYESYVIDPSRQLVGTVSLADLVLSNPESRVKDIAKSDPSKVYTYDDREVAARVLRENHLLALPVVDREDRLVGIITQDDVADILEEEATEDIYRFGAVQGTERGYFTTRVFSVARQRVTWLLVLLVANTITVSVISAQEALLSQVAVLAAFVPLLIGTGGNIGAQSATVVIRGLATGEIRPRRTLRIIGREVSVGLLLGVLLAIAVLVWEFVQGHGYPVSLVVATSLVSVALLGTAVGSALPFVFRLSRIDPALVSAPLVTTVMDIGGVMVYFAIARAVFSF